MAYDRISRSTTRRNWTRYFFFRAIGIDVAGASVRARFTSLGQKLNCFAREDVDEHRKSGSAVAICRPSASRVSITVLHGSKHLRSRRSSRSAILAI
jgi:hypothetical protein